MRKVREVKASLNAYLTMVGFRRLFGQKGANEAVSALENYLKDLNPADDFNFPNFFHTLSADVQELIRSAPEGRSRQELWTPLGAYNMAGAAPVPVPVPAPVSAPASVAAVVPAPASAPAVLAVPPQSVASTAAARAATSVVAPAPAVAAAAYEAAVSPSGSDASSYHSIADELDVGLGAAVKATQTSAAVDARVVFQAHAGAGGGGIEAAAVHTKAAPVASAQATQTSDLTLKLSNAHGVVDLPASAPPASASDKPTVDTNEGARVAGVSWDGDMHDDSHNKDVVPPAAPAQSEVTAAIIIERFKYASRYYAPITIEEAVDESRRYLVVSSLDGRIDYAPTIPPKEGDQLYGEIILRDDVDISELPEDYIIVHCRLNEDGTIGHPLPGGAVLVSATRPYALRSVGAGSPFSEASTPPPDGLALAEEAAARRRGSSVDSSELYAEPQPNTLGRAHASAGAPGLIAAAAARSSSSPLEARAAAEGVAPAAGLAYRQVTLAAAALVPVPTPASASAATSPAAASAPAQAPATASVAAPPPPPVRLVLPAGDPLEAVNGLLSGIFRKLQVLIALNSSTDLEHITHATQQIVGLIQRVKAQAPGSTFPTPQLAMKIQALAVAISSLRGLQAQAIDYENETDDEAIYAALQVERKKALDIRSGLESSMQEAHRRGVWNFFGYIVGIDSFLHEIELLEQKLVGRLASPPDALASLSAAAPKSAAAPGPLARSSGAAAPQAPVVVLAASSASAPAANGGAGGAVAATAVDSAPSLVGGAIRSSAATAVSDAFVGPQLTEEDLVRRAALAQLRELYKAFFAEFLKAQAKFAELPSCIITMQAQASKFEELANSVTEPSFKLAAQDFHRIALGGLISLAESMNRIYGAHSQEELKAVLAEAQRSLNRTQGAGEHAATVALLNLIVEPHSEFVAAANKTDLQFRALAGIGVHLEALLTYIDDPAANVHSVSTLFEGFKSSNIAAIEKLALPAANLMTSVLRMKNLLREIRSLASNKGADKSFKITKLNNEPAEARAQYSALKTGLDAFFGEAVTNVLLIGVNAKLELIAADITALQVSAAKATASPAVAARGAGTSSSPVVGARASVGSGVFAARSASKAAPAAAAGGVTYDSPGTAKELRKKFGGGK